MRTKTTHPAYIRAFIRPLRSYGRDLQMAAVKGAAQVYGPEQRDDWIKSIRGDEVAMVSRLDVIPPVGGKVRPTVDLVAVVSAVVSKCSYMIEASSGVTSRDGKRWQEQLEKAASRIAQGRTLSPKRAREMQREKQKRAGPGTVSRLKADEEWVNRWGPVWRDPARTLEQKLAAMPDEARGLSVSSLYRIFEEPSKPHLKTGRPRKPKRGRK